MTATQPRGELLLERISLRQEARPVVPERRALPDDAQCGLFFLRPVMVNSRELAVEIHALVCFAHLRSFAALSWCLRRMKRRGQEAIFGDGLREHPRFTETFRIPAAALIPAQPGLG